MKSFNNKQLQKSKQASATHSLVHFAAVTIQRPGGVGGGGGGVVRLGILVGGVPLGSPKHPRDDDNLKWPKFTF